MTAVYRAEQVAQLLDVSVWTVRDMARRGRIRRIPGLRALRIPASEVERLLAGEYAVVYGESDGQTPPKATPSWGRHGRQADGPLAGASLDSGNPLHRPIGPKENDVDLRIVKVRGR